jgi:hypothetical protein
VNVGEEGDPHGLRFRLPPPPGNGSLRLNPG